MKMLKTSVLAIIASILILATSCNNKTDDKKEAAKGYMKNQTVNYQEAPKENVHSKNTTTITDKNFKKTIKEGVTLVDFWATWCKPCLMQGPIIEQIAEELKDKAVIGKMDVDLNPGVPREFNIANIPTIMIFKDGVMVERFVGLQSKQNLMSALEKHLNN